MNQATRIRPEDLHDLCLTILLSGGVDKIQAVEVANNLVWSELIGRENFGLLRLPVYLERVAKGGLKCPCAPHFTRVSESISNLDADSGFGQFAANLATDEAISLARNNGIGTVGVRNSNFFGTGAYFVNKIANQGMIGLAMSNSFPKVVAYGGLKPVFGTNPFAFGAPRANGENLIFDMATSALAGSTVREHIDKGKPLPEGMAIDSDGVAITDPSKVAEGALLPVAGAKGYGLALLVEILAGVLTGAGVSDGVTSMYKDRSAPGDNGHFVIAIDTRRFMPIEQFHARFEALVAMIKSSRGSNEILLPGEIRWRNREQNSKAGIKLGDATRSVVEKICGYSDIVCPW
ncbi:MAG: Ldh family oxidoreductase [Fimbriimonadaceae bacterium]|nr:Ldh family oxidoreductase [Alphaproteobacteria bacterium]